MFYDKWKVKIFLRSHCYDKPLEHEWIVLVGLTLVKMIWKRLYEDICRYQWFLEVIVCMPSDWHISYRNANAVKPCYYLELFGDCENTYNIWGHEVKNLKEKAVETSKWLWHIHGIWDTLYWWSRNWNSSVYFCFPCPNQCKHQFSLSVHVPHCINLYRGLQ